MPKIDTSKIEGYAEMTPEQKLAALEGYEYEDHSEELERQKAAVTKANGEAAEWKRKHTALLSEDEKKKQEDADKLASMEEELAELRKGKVVSDYKAKFVAQGYSEELADETAKALADGDMTKVFANQQKFLADYVKGVKAGALKGTPKPPAGGSATDVDFAKKIEEAQKSGDLTAVAYYTRLQAQAEAEAKNK